MVGRSTQSLYQCFTHHKLSVNVNYYNCFIKGEIEAQRAQVTDAQRHRSSGSFVPSLSQPNNSVSSILCCIMMTYFNSNDSYVVVHSLTHSFIQPTSTGRNTPGTVRALGHRQEHDPSVCVLGTYLPLKKNRKQTGG